MPATTPSAVASSERISPAAARRIALAAQGFAMPRPAGAVTARHIRKVLDSISILQLDSVNVFCRSHYLPIFARLGPYSRDILDDLTAHRRGRVRREYVEYWAHQAALVPVGLHPMFRWRMAKHTVESWGAMARVQRENPKLIAELLERMSADGPIRAGDTGFVRPNRPGEMWNWHEGKIALEHLFFSGQAMASRRVNFERWYDLTEHVLPPAVQAQPTQSDADQRLALTALAARACGIGTLSDIADYFRMIQAPTKFALDRLIEAGEVRQVSVAGWDAPAYLWAAARRPRRVDARALLSPFDSLVWFRPRTERLFGFHYRIEIYVPAPKRVFGYYVLPFLLGDRLVARVDLKADRASGALLVQSAFAEDGVGSADWPEVDEVCAELAAELRVAADWLALDRVVVRPRGDLAPHLAVHVEAGGYATE